MATVLAQAALNLQRTTFDIHNDEHIEAFRSLYFDGRQHPTLRFHIEAPYLDVRSMMTDKVLRHCLNQPQHA